MGPGVYRTVSKSSNTGFTRRNHVGTDSRKPVPPQVTLLIAEQPAYK